MCLSIRTSGLRTNSYAECNRVVHKFFRAINLPDKRIFTCKLIKHLHPIATARSAARVTNRSNRRSTLTEAVREPCARRRGHEVATQKPTQRMPSDCRRGHSARFAAAARRSERRCRVYPIRFDRMWVEGIAGLNLGRRLSRKTQFVDKGRPQSRRSFRVIQPLLAKTRTIFHSVGDEPFSADLHGAFSRARRHHSSTHSKSARAVYLRVAHATTATVIILARSVSEDSGSVASLTLRARMMGLTTPKRCYQST